MTRTPKSSRAPRALSVRTLSKSVAALGAVLVLATACGEDGPNYPDVFDPVAIGTELDNANLSMSSPATESFASVGFLIDGALGGGGGPLVVDAPARLVADGPLAIRTATATRLKASHTMANAIPAGALGKTFVYDAELDDYVMSQQTGAPANGVRFILYAISDETGYPVEPLIEVGHADLTRTATSNSATARVQVLAGTVNPTAVLDYTARVRGTVSVPTIEVAGFARNAEDRMDFTLETAFNLSTETLEIDWRTAVPTQDLATRLIQRFSGDEESSQFSIDAAIVSASGRVDIDGTIDDLTGGELLVKVNGQTFATMALANGEQEEPVITNADGEPLTEDEHALLVQIFQWFLGAIFVFVGLLGPVGPLLDTAF